MQHHCPLMPSRLHLEARSLECRSIFLRRLTSISLTLKLSFSLFLSPHILHRSTLWLYSLISYKFIIPHNHTFSLFFVSLSLVIRFLTSQYFFFFWLSALCFYFLRKKYCNVLKIMILYIFCCWYFVNTIWILLWIFHEKFLVHIPAPTHVKS